MEKIEKDPYKRFFVQKLYNSKAWLIYCICQLIMTALLIFYVMIDLKNHARSSLVSTFETILTLSILLDVSVHYYLTGKNSFKDPLFLLDVIILISFILVILWMMGNTSPEEEELDVGLLIVRGIFQLFRFFVFAFKMHKKIEERKAIEEINLEESPAKQGGDVFGGRFIDVEGEKDEEAEEVNVEMRNLEKANKREIDLII